MQTKELFKETQRFTQWWLWALLLGVNGLFLYGLLRQILLEQQWGNNPLSTVWLFIIFGTTFFLTLLFRSFRLETRIKEDGIYVKFFPFHFNYKKYEWTTISKCYITQYSPIREYRGWGIRYGYKRKAYNVSGNMGLQLEFTNGKKLLIGTNKAEELKEALNTMRDFKILNSY